MSAPLTEPLRKLAERLRAVTRGARLRATAAFFGVAFLVALLSGRHGTLGARVGGWALIAVTIAFGVVWWGVDRRKWRALDSVLRGPVRRVDRDRAERASRALSLLGPAGDALAGGTSPELARLHVARALADIPGDAVVERASRRAGRVRAAALGVGGCTVAVALYAAWPLFEGGDILMARSGVAPIAMQWLQGVEVFVRPPDYLHEPPIHEIARTPLLLPYGSVVTLRGTPARPGRHLFLSDGATELPFVDDGAGAVVARYTLAKSTVLGVVARFGQTVIGESESLPITSIADAPPVVVLEGAPRVVQLVTETSDIPIKYEATDDHGLREVHLVLRSGVREERRVLARLDGETTADSGGEVFRLRDPFLAKSHTLVEVTVEAKDNDPLTGPKWGASPPITIVPPDVGEPEARRLDALRRLRDSLVDTLGARLQGEMPAGGDARKGFVAADVARTDADEALLGETLNLAFAGIHVPSRVRALLVAQQQATRKAVVAEVKEPSEASHASVVRATERFVLVADAAVRGLGMRGAREASKELADVADDVALGAGQLRNDSSEIRGRGARTMDAAMGVLLNGGRSMLRLGELGRDLGEIVASDGKRVSRARKENDFAHAELAARDLAARLRQPDPSFGARGGRSMGRAGGEAGGAHGADGDDLEPPDEVEQAFDEAAQDLERLAQEHAGEISKTEEALSEASGDDELKAMRQEAKRHADAVREAARTLPSVGMGSDSWTSKGAAARDLAEEMARALEQARPDNAVESGRSAVGSLDEAKKMLQRGAWMQDPSGEHQRDVEGARRKLEEEAQWAEEQHARMRKRAADRARGQLEQGGRDEEGLAERARQLSERGKASGSLPDKAVESIDDAARSARQAAEALKRGDAEQGLDKQREAQRNLEAARQQIQGDDDDSTSPSAQEGDGRKFSGAPVSIPNARDHMGPEEFRQRVVRGLGQSASGGLRDAVQRYAEGLLR